MAVGGTWVLMDPVQAPLPVRVHSGAVSGPGGLWHEARRAVPVG